ncbi:MAG: HIT domain-containing protein, partial [Actinobacteria bacterium]|nr:HIT domain-containing protein [Actinomycetota bacterium]
SPTRRVGGGGARRSAAKTPCSSTGRAAGTAPTTRHGSSPHRSASSSACAAQRSRTRGSSLPSDPRPDCLFCKLARQGDHVARVDGFVAIHDVDPQAETHLLVLPERHVDTFRDVSAFPAGEAQRMLEFVAETARGAGLEDYRVLVNVGPRGGQTIFHLHWHILGGKIRGMPR